MKRLTGLLILEVRDSNPNGDPDQDSAPRSRHDGRGEISPVSVKRKLRDLVMDKGPVWSGVGSELREEEFDIWESRGRDRDIIQGEGNAEAFLNRFWDARLFGCTALEEKSKKKSKNFIRTGAAQFGVGLSVAPINIREMTFTNISGVEADKDRGMAPLAFKVVEHAVYTVPFFVNPSMASKSRCAERDVDLMLKLLPFAYNHTRSLVRSHVEVLHIHTFTHLNALGSITDLRFIDALKPQKREKSDDPSVSLRDYDFPTWDSVRSDFDGRGSYKDYALQ